MPFAATADVVSTAAARRGAVGAFEVAGPDDAATVVAGAEAAGRAVLLRVCTGGLAPVAAACRAVATAAVVPVGLHLDGVPADEPCDVAAGEGFGSLTFDASAQPFGENVARTRAVVLRSRPAGLWVAGRLAAGGRTDPDEAALFVAETSVDALAVAATGAGDADLDLDLLARLRAAVPVPLALRPHAGVADAALAAAVDCGVVKVDVAAPRDADAVARLCGVLG